MSPKTAARKPRNPQAPHRHCRATSHPCFEACLTFTQASSVVREHTQYAWSVPFLIMCETCSTSNPIYPESHVDCAYDDVIVVSWLSFLPPSGTYGIHSQHCHRHGQEWLLLVSQSCCPIMDVTSLTFSDGWIAQSRTHYVSSSQFVQTNHPMQHESCCFCFYAWVDKCQFVMLVIKAQVVKKVQWTQLFRKAMLDDSRFMSTSM